MRRFAPLIKSIFFDWRRFSCYLLIVAVMLTTRTLFLLIFVNIILIRILFPVIRETLLNASGISIFLSQIKYWQTNIPDLILPQEHLPVCSVLIFYLLILKSILLPIGLPSLRSILFMLSSVVLTLETLLVLVLFMIFSGNFGIQILITFLPISVFLKRKK
mgnify:FL=1